MALWRPRSSHVTLINSSLSHLLRRHSPPSAAAAAAAAAAAPALIRHFRAGRRDDFPPSFEREAPSNWGILVVPQQSAYVIERLGKYHKTLEGGIHFLIPIIDKVAYVHSLKEEFIHISDQSAISSDNVTVLIDGIVCVRIVDPMLASYEVSNAIRAVKELSQTTLRSEVGKMDLDTIFMERSKINEKIVSVITEAASGWGLQCIRYEIKNISPPPGVKATMEMQVEAERRKRAQILESEGKRQSVILEAEAEAKAIRERAKARAEELEMYSAVVRANGGGQAANLALAQEYMKAFGNIAKEGTTMLLPGGPEGSASMIAQALSMFKTISNANSITGGSSADFSSVFGDDSRTDDRARLEELEAPNSDSLSASDPRSDPNAEVFSLQSPRK